MRKYFLFFILLSHTLLFSAETIYAWGYGDILGQTLRAVKFTFASGGFLDAWKITMALILLWATTSSSFGMLSSGYAWAKAPKVLILSTGIWAVFIQSNIDVYIDDRANPNNNMSIAAVPWGVAYPMAKFSQLEKDFSATMETMFSLPADISHSNSGMLTPISIFNAATQHKIVDPNLFLNVNNYIIECVMPDIETGYKNYQDIVSSDTLWTYFGDTNPAIFAMYRNDDGSQSLRDCQQFYTEITGKVNTYVSNTGKGMEYLSKSIGTISATTVSSVLGTSANWLMGTSTNAQALLLQTTSMNMFSDAYIQYAALNSQSSQDSAYYAAKAQSMAESNAYLTGYLGRTFIPVVKGILTTILMALTPIMPLLMLTPMTFTVLLGFIGSLLWLSLWHIGEIVLNFIILVKAQNNMTDIGRYNFEVKGLIDSQAQNYIYMADSLYMYIPFIAAFVVGGFAWSGLRAIGASAAGAVGTGGSFAAREMGNADVSFGKRAYNTTSANSNNLTNNLGMGRQENIIDKFNAEHGTDFKVGDVASNASGAIMGGGSSMMSGHLGKETSAFTGLDSQVDIMGKGKTFAPFMGQMHTADNGNGTARLMEDFKGTDKYGNTYFAKANTVFDRTTGAIISGETGGTQKTEQGVMNYEADYSSREAIRVKMSSPDNVGVSKETTIAANGEKMHTFTLGDKGGSAMSITTDGDYNVQKINGYDRQTFMKSASREEIDTLSKALGYDITKSSGQTQASKEAESNAYGKIGQVAYEKMKSSSEGDSSTKSYEQGLLSSSVKDLTKSGLLDHAASRDVANAEKNARGASINGEVKTGMELFGMGAGVSLKASAQGETSLVYTLKDGTTYSHSLSAKEAEILQKTLGEKIANSYTKSNQEGESNKNSASVSNSYEASVVNEASSQYNEVEAYKSSLIKQHSLSTKGGMTITDNKMYEEIGGYLKQRILKDGVHEDQAFKELATGKMTVSNNEIKEAKEEVQGAKIQSVNNKVAKHNVNTDGIPEPQEVKRQDIDQTAENNFNSKEEQKKREEIYKVTKDSISGNFDKPLEEQFKDNREQKQAEKRAADRHDPIKSSTYPNKKNFSQEDKQPSIPGQPTGDVATALSQDKLKVEGVSAVFDKKIEPQQAHQNQSSQTVAKEAKEEVRKSRPIVPDR